MTRSEDVAVAHNWKWQWQRSSRHSILCILYAACDGPALPLPQLKISRPPLIHRSSPASHPPLIVPFLSTPSLLRPPSLPHPPVPPSSTTPHLLKVCLNTSSFTGSPPAQPPTQHSLVPQYHLVILGSEVVMWHTALTPLSASAPLSFIPQHPPPPQYTPVQLLSPPPG